MKLSLKETVQCAIVLCVALNIKFMGRLEITASYNTLALCGKINSSNEMKHIFFGVGVYVCFKIELNL